MSCIFDPSQCYGVDRTWGIRLPGFGLDEVKVIQPPKQAQVASSHISLVACDVAHRLDACNVSLNVECQGSLNDKAKEGRLNCALKRSIVLHH